MIYLKDFNWNDSFAHSTIYDKERSVNYSNLSTHYDENNRLYLTVNNMIVSKSLQYGTQDNFFNNNYIVAKNMNNLNYFNDRNAFSTIAYQSGLPAINTGTNFGSTGWGGFSLTDENGSNKITIPFDNLNTTDKIFYQNQFNYLGEKWILQYGWAINGIFIFSVYQQTGSPKKFKISFNGRYMVPDYNDSNDYSQNGEIAQSVNKFNSPFDIYTHYHWYRNSEDAIKTTYTVIPYQAIGINQKPYSSIYSSTQIKYYGGFSYYYGTSYTYRNYNNAESVNTMNMEYGCTIYVQWGKQLPGKTLEIDVQNWIINDLQLGANFKMCNYNTVVPMNNYNGTRETHEIDISSASVVNSSRIDWDAIIPDNSEIKIESNVSFDSGLNWTGWKEVGKNQEIPQLVNGMNLKNAFLKLRETLSAKNEFSIPRLYDVNVEIIAPQLKYLISDGDEIKTYVREFNWEKYPYNVTGYMESNTYPEPNIITCSSVFNMMYEGYKAFNHTNDTSYDCWATANGSVFGWLQYDFGENNKQKLYKYKVISRNANDTDSAPKKWQLLASNDNSNWIIVDTQIDQINWSRNQTREYDVIMEDQYRYFKIDISENNGNDSVLTIGQIEFYSLKYQVINEFWQTVPETVINKDLFERYGFEDIENFDCSKLNSLNNIKVHTSINNLRYLPHINYRGFTKTATREMVEIEETGLILKRWSEYQKDEIVSNVIISSRQFNSTNPKKLKIITDARRGTVVEKTLPIKILNDKPIITGFMTNTMLTCKISDKNKDKIRFNVKLNNVIIHPSKGNTTEWLNGPINFKHIFTSKEFNINKINIVEVYAEDKYGGSDTLLLTFAGNYGNVILKDEEGNIFSDDMGGVIRYIDFGQMFSGNITDPKKIIIENQNGYTVKNIHVQTINPYESSKIELSFTANPFRPVDELTYMRNFLPGGQGIFFARIKTNISSETTTQIFPIKITAEPVN